MDSSQISTYFGKFQDSEIVGGEDFLPEDFICCKGTILVVIPPPKPVTEGGIVIPEGSLESPSVGRVASIPQDDPLCPVKPGDWIVTRHMEGQPVTFSRRTDLRIIQFSADHQSEILGFFPAEMYDEAQKRSLSSRPAPPAEEEEDAPPGASELVDSEAIVH